MELSPVPAALAQLHPDALSAPFWEHALAHRLVVPRCAGCDGPRMPPTGSCPLCSEPTIDWRPAQGTGTVHTFTVTRQAFHQLLADYLPYAVALVALDDHPDVRLPTNVVGIDDADLAVGMPVRVVWDDVDATTSIPRFGPAGGG